MSSFEFDSEGIEDEGGIIPRVDVNDKGDEDNSEADIRGSSTGASQGVQESVNTPTSDNMGKSMPQNLTYRNFQDAYKELRDRLYDDEKPTILTNLLLEGSPSPKRNRASSKSNSRSGTPRQDPKTYDRLFNFKKRSDAKIEQLRQDQISQQNDSCSFKPTTTRYRSTSSSQLSSSKSQRDFKTFIKDQVRFQRALEDRQNKARVERSAKENEEITLAKKDKMSPGSRRLVNLKSNLNPNSSSTSNILSMTPQERLTQKRTPAAKLVINTSLTSLHNQSQQRRSQENYSLNPMVALTTPKKKRKPSLPQRTRRGVNPRSAQVSRGSTPKSEDSRSRNLIAVGGPKKGVSQGNKKSNLYLKQKIDREFEQALKDLELREQRISYLNLGELLKVLGYVRDDPNNQVQFSIERMVLHNIWTLFRGIEQTSSGGIKISNLKKLILATYRVIVDKPALVPKDEDPPRMNRRTASQVTLDVTAINPDTSQVDHLYSEESQAENQKILNNIGECGENLDGFTRLEEIPSDDPDMILLMSIGQWDQTREEMILSEKDLPKIRKLFGILVSNKDSRSREQIGRKGSNSSSERESFQPKLCQRSMKMMSKSSSRRTSLLNSPRKNFLKENPGDLSTSSHKDSGELTTTVPMFVNSNTSRKSSDNIRLDSYCTTSAHRTTCSSPKSPHRGADHVVNKLYIQGVQKQRKRSDRSFEDLEVAANCAEMTFKPRLITSMRKNSVSSNTTTDGGDSVNVVQRRMDVNAIPNFGKDIHRIRDKKRLKSSDHTPNEVLAMERYNNMVFGVERDQKGRMINNAAGAKKKSIKRKQGGQVTKPTGDHGRVKYQRKDIQGQYPEQHSEEQ